MFIAKEKSIAHCVPRKPSNLNRLYQYDGNLIGGFILGGGMALSGACPGTALVQIATGTSSSILVLGGAVLGGMLWSRFGHCAKVKPSASSAVSSTKTCPSAEESLTVYGSGTTTELRAVIVYELLCLAMIISASYLTLHSVESSRLNPIVGGLAIGAAQAVSLIFTGSPIGVSTAYENIGECVNRITGSSLSKGAPWPSMSPIIFILGMLGGSWGLTKALGIKVLAETVHVSWARAFIGGIALVIGARTAGGCTSGHGISGMSTLAKSSFVTVGAMFAGGIAVSAFLRHL